MPHQLKVFPILGLCLILMITFSTNRVVLTPYKAVHGGVCNFHQVRLLFFTSFPGALPSLLLVMYLDAGACSGGHPPARTSRWNRDKYTVTIQMIITLLYRGRQCPNSNGYNWNKEKCNAKTQVIIN